MSNPELNSLDDFERFVRSTIKPWSPEQRIALTVSMAERWLRLDTRIYRFLWAFRREERPNQYGG